MATSKDIAFKSYCDRVYDELSGMKSRLLDFVKDIEMMRGPEAEMLRAHIPHYYDIVRTIDWKLEILTKVCPFEWTKYAGEVERTSVQPMEEETVAGYVGG